MQREIKFRAWDKEAQEMLTVRDINFCGEELDTYEMQGDWLSFEDVELMQYTGFKDRNGIEIYEGDIYHMGDKKFTYTVPSTGNTSKRVRFILADDRGEKDIFILAKNLGDKKFSSFLEDYINNRF